MLRITVAQTQDAICLRLEGKLAGPWIEVLAFAWARIQQKPEPATCVINLSGVTFVSAEGRILLARIAREGAEFHASDVMNLALIEDIGRHQVFG